MAIPKEQLRDSGSVEKTVADTLDAANSDPGCQSKAEPDLSRTGPLCEDAT